MYLAESCTARPRPECGHRMQLSPLTSATPDGGRRPLGWPLRRSAARRTRGARLGREVLRQPGSLRARRGAATSTRGARRGAGQLWRGAAESRQQSRSASCPPHRCCVCPAAGALLQVRAKSSPRSVRLPGSAAMALCDHERHRAAAQLLRCPAPLSGRGLAWAPRPLREGAGLGWTTCLRAAGVAAQGSAPRVGPSVCAPSPSCPNCHLQRGLCGAQWSPQRGACPPQASKVLST